MFDLEANKAVALRLVEVFNGCRPDLLEDVLHPEFRGRDTFPLIPPFASRVHELIQKNGLSVEMIACAHGNAMPYAQFAYVLGK
jgi:hypothetical protein